ncbi:MAG: homoserine dehydrogenase [Deinococcus sp.]|nr:homoserine dehydrogenase [Deinococcus sp.]
MLRVALLGCGTVGTGVLELLSRSSLPLVVRGVAVAHLDRPRAPVVSPELLTDRPFELVSQSDVDVVVELIGGLDPAESLVRAALEAGKDVVTANKALIAERGEALLALARSRGRRLLYEASVCAGTPVIRAARALAAGGVWRLAGILNGTCNYVLSRMAAGMEFDDAVRLAQQRGFAEADPTLDISGRDAAQKLVVLVREAMGLVVPPDAFAVEGIAQVRRGDLLAAREQGYALKLVAVARRDGEKLQLRVHPGLIPLGHPLAQVEEELNALLIESDGTGEVFLRGRGAGALPTATAVLADLLELMTGAGTMTLATPARLSIVPHGEVRARRLLRIEVADELRAVRTLTDQLAAAGVSLDHLSAYPVPDRGTVLTVLTGRAPGANLANALAALVRADLCTAPVRSYLLEELGEEGT